MNNKVSFFYSEVTTSYCYSCGHFFESGEKKFKGDLRIQRYTDKKGCTHERVYAECVCKNCSMVDAAHLEAKDESRRVTEICIGKEDSHIGYTYGMRCLCGRVTHVKKDWCLLCESEKRLIKQVDADTKLFRRMLRDLNSQIKETTKQTKEWDLL